MQSSPRTFQSKIFSTTGLQKKLRQLRKRKPRTKVVFTNGCFDILHIGHVTYLERARKKGDILIVALNSDASVRKIKGATRPIVPLKLRQKVLAALESVDFVTSFSDPTPLKLIQKLKPNVLVKGGDWKPSQIVGSKEVYSWNGKVFSLPFIKGNSSTRLIRKLEG